MAGTGVTADAREAVRWYLRAAEVGHANAQINLGVCYKKRHWRGG
jgi:TPR repeat protein